MMSSCAPCEVVMAFTYPQIITLAKESGFPANPTSTYRPGARTKSGNVSWHASGRAVDFWGYSQDDLASYFLGKDTLEVFHKSVKTGIWYGSSRDHSVSETANPQLVKDHENHVHVAMSEEQVANVKSSGLAGAVMSALSPITGVLQGTNVVDVFRPFGIAGVNIISPDFWRRIGTGVLGVGMIITGTLFLMRRPIVSGAASVVRGVGGVANTALQGAAFGVGAGATGGLGSRSVSAPPRRGPLPPMMDAPVTAPAINAQQSSGGTYSITTYRGSAKAPARPLPNYGTSGWRGKGRGRS